VGDADGGDAVTDDQDPFVAAMRRGRAALFARGFRDLYAEDAPDDRVSILAKCEADVGDRPRLECPGWARIDVRSDATPAEIDAAIRALRCQRADQHAREVAP
jgi:hypothetical protein